MPRDSCCPACSGPGDPLGALGHTEWMRCRHCGLTYGRPPHTERATPIPATPASAPYRKAPSRCTGRPPG